MFLKEFMNMCEIPEDLWAYNNKMNISVTGYTVEYHRAQLFPALNLTPEDFERQDQIRSTIFNQKRAREERDLHRPDLKGND